MYIWELLTGLAFGGTATGLPSRSRTPI